MNLLRSLCIAFSMYSRLPVPQCRWDERSMRFVLLCFPFVGALQGLLLTAAAAALRAFALPSLLSGALLTAGFFLYTGGIHMDGFMDMLDALGSNREREEMLRILKDPHAGSFAVLGCVLVCLLQFAGSTALYESRGGMAAFAAGLVLSRALSALLLLTMPNARGAGLAYTFTDAAVGSITRMGLLILMAAAVVVLRIFGGRGGIAAAAAAGSIFLLCRIRAGRALGGATGDTAGWFLTLCETAELCILAALLSGR